MKVAEYHRRLESPRYMYAVRMAQSMLEDYPSIASRGEVSYRDRARESIYGKSYGSHNIDKIM